MEDAGGNAAQIRLPPAPGGFFVPFWPVKKGHPRPIPRNAAVVETSPLIRRGSAAPPSPVGKAGGPGVPPLRKGGRKRRPSVHRSADRHQAPLPVGACAPSRRMAGRQQEGAQVCPHPLRWSTRKGSRPAAPVKRGSGGRRCGDEGACARSRFHRQPPARLSAISARSEMAIFVPRKIKRIAAAMYGGPT